MEIFPSAKARFCCSSSETDMTKHSLVLGFVLRRDKGGDFTNKSASFPSAGLKIKGKVSGMICRNIERSARQNLT